KFFDANRCGPDAGTGNAFSWRGACHTGDKDGTVDLTGGYHDAGDHVKFGLPQCWSAATLGWALYEYPTVFTGTRKDKMLRVIKHFTDYFLKCNPSAGTFYYNIGDGNADHGYWGTPEAQTGARPVIKAPPGSDVCALGAAALALMYLNYKSVDATYADRCLASAKNLWNIAFANCGTKETARSSDGSGGNFYKTSSHYDDMCWGGIWLYTATKESKYLDSIGKWIAVPNDPGDNQFQKKWSPAWDDQVLFVHLKMAEMGNSKCYDGLIWNLEWCRDVCNKSPSGLPVIDVWGVLRYASAEAGLGFLGYKLLGYSGFNTKGSFIIDYCLGKNPETRSYVTGWGRNPPIHPHHRANEPVKGGPVKGIEGALVGGPTDDVYADNIDNFQETEVALDYNASFILGLAGQIFIKGGGKPKNRPPSVSITSPKNGVSVPQGATITIKVSATDADGKLTKIELFKGDQSVATSTTSPLSYAWQNAPLGNATFKANAVDDSGNVSVFSSVTIHVDAPCTPGTMMSRTGWEATASNYSPNASEAVHLALDGDVGTRYSSGAGLSNGMWFQLDMGYPRDFDQIVIVSAGSDFPATCRAYAGNDTGNFGNAIATATGNVTTTITLDKPVNGQYIRLVSGSSSGSWWSIHEINVRCAPLTNKTYPVKPSEISSFTVDAHLLNNTVRVDYSIPEPGWVTVEGYSLSGARTIVLVDGFSSAGHHAVTFNADRFNSKMVLLKISSKGSTKLKKVTLFN
ncbi:MAG: glycoside hydrolase family 9 protein, partial [Chitinispirillaceae bacterium]|nr:glycoside hydrolase family 9 protein [Chitinispirillaceae bacterium]